MTSTAEWVEARLNYESVPAALRGTGSRSLRHHRGRMDAFLRRDDTWIARLSASLSGTQGTGYMGSRAKRSLDILIGGSMLLPALPLILVLMALNRLLHPRHPALFRQKRVGRDGRPMRIVKIRSLLPAPAPGEPPGLTRFGTFLRRHNLDELPQLVQVLRGDLSLVGIRILPYPVYRGLAAAWSPERTRSWRCAYAHSALGLTGVHQVFRREGKEDELRFWRDRFYLRHASLGFDLYLIWRTIGRRQR